MAFRRRLCVEHEASRLLSKVAFHAV